MFVNQLLNPKSISIIGASNDITKIGGKALFNIINGGFHGDIYVVNPKEDIVQGFHSYHLTEELPHTELAIIAISCKYVPAIMKQLANCGTKAFIVLSAGFSELGEEGYKLEQEILDIANSAEANLIGPNCIGVLTNSYNGVFAGPIPKLENQGCDFVTGSGAMAVFIIENAIMMGVPFSSVFSVGNSAQIGVEEVLEHWDHSYIQGESAKVKIMYLEKISNPKKFLDCCRSLINKGCKIAAIKAGVTEAGSRAASSHTGALASSDSAVSALFQKAGIIRCYSREELVYVSGILLHKELKDRRIAVITHAGGPGVLLTDSLNKNGMQTPKIEGEAATELLQHLYYGSSVSNPIDFLATGTAEQLEQILDYVDNQFDNIDGSAVIFGTPGLIDIEPVYDVLHRKMSSSKKPIFAVLPSIVQVRGAVENFISRGRINFPDEVCFGNALAKVYTTPPPAPAADITNNYDLEDIREIIDACSDGYQRPDIVQKLLDAVEIPRVKEMIAETKGETIEFSYQIGYPVAMKAIGHVHKTEVGGVILNVKNQDEAEAAYDKLISIQGVKSVLIQFMSSGIELYIGVKRESNYGHLILFGLGGVFIEILEDVQTALAPVTHTEALKMIKNLKSVKLLEGYRGKDGINISAFADIIVSMSALVAAAPEIEEMDINPLMATKDMIVAVDARISIKK
ncbi:MAG: acetate--CoA ligase family protein [Candidatus Kapabacteria bacterium]|nr:acetate--CoA ligase family protein [Candidatus Kapabacteria bacterium]